MELDIHLTDEALEIKASNPGKDLWSVFRKKGSNKLNKSELKERNIIKLGNFLCFVRKINLQNIKKPNERSEDNSLNSQFDDKEVIKMSQNIRQCTSSQPYFLKPKPEEIEKEERICRICLNEENSEINPLINPCRCSGSMKWIHLKCLRKWLFNKVELVEDEIIRIYAWKDLNCELCKGPLKSNFFL